MAIWYHVSPERFRYPAGRYSPKFQQRGIPPTIKPADVVKMFKGVSARRLLLEFPHLERSTGRGTLWAPSYFIATAGNVSAETIRRYIEEQRHRELVPRPWRWHHPHGEVGGYQESSAA